MRTLVCGALIASVLTAFASPAFATDRYVEQKTSEGQDIRFIDADGIDGLDHNPKGDQITGFHPPRRFDLLRPRTSFVHEMLKSVEAL